MPDRQIAVLTRGGSPRPSPADAALDELFPEVVRLFHRLRAVAEDLHGDVFTEVQHGVLRELHDSGPRTVPAMARSRLVSRQHIQTVVNGLRERGLVETVPNPDHRRSRLVRLTVRGRDLVAAAGEREREALERLDPGVSPAELRSAAAVLRAIRECLEQADRPGPAAAAKIPR